ncbi:MAG: hypothetical protein H0A76_13085 [Candidatus Thiodubiliella endoseptemdiera]|uniref:Uncharacterized protein n=1 Tax=Candidatus Thiodubiliella endoseptemdiera TaxID=2738886 RepID=A0A853F6K3_9GAMM|nr:hypothetical protein [Candidatus Thiodubiliella endoseptemdiera]
MGTTIGISKLGGYILKAVLGMLPYEWKIPGKFKSSFFVEKVSFLTAPPPISRVGQDKKQTIICILYFKLKGTDKIKEIPQP